MVSASAAARQPIEAGVLSENAIRYAIEQLAVRAGVQDRFLSAWRIRPEPGFIRVEFQAGSRKCVRFPVVGAAAWARINAGRFRTGTARWPETGSGFRSIAPNLKIPFSSSETTDLGPLFVADGPDCFTCAVDLPLSILLTLSRFEETLPAQRDIHDRFPARSSIAWREGFLERPIVDEYGLAFEQLLQALLPGWRPQPRKLQVKLGHDMDEIGIPFSLRSAAAKTLRRFRPGATLRDLLSAVLGTETTGLADLKRLISLSLERKLDSAVYWKNSRKTAYDTGYDLCDPRVRKAIRFLEESNVEIGVHPSYETFRAPDRLCAEVTSLKRFLGKEKVGGRQDYLRWCPETWKHWEDAGISYDSSVGFADHIGFRAGTCVPYRPWLWTERRPANLIEIPLLVSDSALRSYMKVRPSQALRLMRRLVGQCSLVGGVFTAVWHNTTLLNPGYTKIYQTLLDEIAQSPKYNWGAAAA